LNFKLLATLHCTILYGNLENLIKKFNKKVTNIMSGHTK
jgi:hypothetical protein